MFKSFNKKKIKIIFSFDYYVGISTSNAYQSFDIMKYKKIRDRLVKEKLIKRKNILSPEMATYEDLALVHTREYLKSIQDPVKVGQMLRIGAVEPWDSYIVEFFRTVTGGTILAADYALKNNGIIFNIGGGFHHAYSDHAAGFCLLNDIAVAIEKARIKHDLTRVLIIDLDYHQGDGYLEFYKNEPNVYTFSMNAARWLDINKENNLDILLPHNLSGKEYLDILYRNLDPVFETFLPDLVIYIAGSDPYELDTLCDLNLSREDMLQRNLYVANLVKSIKVPMVVVAGGGYGVESWKIYYDFIAKLLRE